MKRLYLIIGLARSSYYYYWQSTTAPRAVRGAADVALARKVRAAHTASDGTDGAPQDHC